MAQVDKDSNDEIAKLQQICKELEDKSNYQEEECSNIKQIAESNALNISLN